MKNKTLITTLLIAGGQGQAGSTTGMVCIADCFKAALELCELCREDPNAEASITLAIAEEEAAP